MAMGIADYLEGVGGDNGVLPRVSLYADQFEAVEVRIDLEHALEDLAVDALWILEQHFFEGRSIEELARLRGVSESALRKRLCNLIKVLRKRMCA